MRLAPLVRRRAAEAPARYTRRHYRSIAAFVVAVALLGLHQDGSTLQTELIVVWLAYSMSVIGFYWMFAVSGRFAFCQTLMMALGAYLSAYLSRSGDPFWWSIVGAVLGVGVVAALVGYMLRKAQAFYFAIATLALTNVGLVVFTQWTEFTGPSGTVIGVAPITVFGTAIDTNRGMVWFFLAALAAILVLNAWLERSPLYREAVAARDLEMVSRSAGVRVTSVQVMMFSIGSAAGGLSGALLAHRNGFVGTDSFGIDLAIGIFLMLILGGRGSVWGPVIGAAIYVELPQILSGYQRYQTIIYGAILLVAIIVMPEGIVSIGTTIREWARRLRPSRVGGVPEVAEGSAVEELSSDAPAQVPADVDGALGRALEGTSVAASGGADEVLLEAVDLSVHFRGVRALDGVSFRLRRGEILGVVGPNGSGKTTLLNAVTGVVSASGRLTVDGRTVRLERPRASRAAGIARTFQSPQMVPALSALENVALGSDDHVGRGVAGSWMLRPRMWRHERPRWETGAELLASVGARGIGQANGGELPYGHQRLVEVGRALAGRPSVVMLDEPSAGLNDAETIELAALLRSLRESGISLIVVDHKLGLIGDICDRVLVLQLGQVIADGPSEQVWRDPAVADAYLGSLDDA